LVCLALSLGGNAVGPQTVKAPGQLPSLLAGYVHDIWQLATCRFRNPHSYLKYLMIRRVGEATRSRTFVESGTFLGGTASRCAGIFDRVYTVELDPGLADRARQNLASHRNVTVIQGDGLAEIDRLFSSGAVAEILVFLDGHYSGVGTAKGVLVEPAVKEIEMLTRYRHLVNAVVIDDFRAFGVEFEEPSKASLLRAIETGFPHPEFDLQVQNDLVMVMRRR
jgi:hypothetical protein